MNKIDYDLLIYKNKMHTHYIAMQISPNISMRNIQNHSHYEILYIPEGERVLVAEKKQYVLNKNSIALVPPYTLHRTLRGNSDPCGKYKKYLINFTKDYIFKMTAFMDVDLLSAFQQNLILFHLDDEEAEFVRRTMVDMLRYNDSDDLCDEQIFRCLLGVLLTFFSKKANKELVYNEIAITDKIIEYMENNFEQDITLELLSRQFYVSKFEVSRMFSKNTGIPFVEYLTRIRIENSKKLLLDTELSITRISELTGFHSSSNFSRVFKKLMGISPVQYRKDAGNEVE